MVTVNVKDFEDNTIVLSHEENLYDAVEQEFDIEPGYTVKLFRGEEELDREASILDGDVIRLVRVPSEFVVSLDYIETVPSKRRADCYKYMISIREEGLHEFYLYFYEENGLFIPGAKVVELSHIDYDDKDLVFSIEELFKEILPVEYNDEIRSIIISCLQEDYLYQKV